MSERGETSRASVRRHGDLEIQEDLPFQRREWLAERMAWAVMGLLIAAAILGLFGTGPLSRMTAGDWAGPLWLEYERFARLLAPAVLRVHLGPAAARDRTVSLWIDRRYMENVELQQVTAAARQYGGRTGPADLQFSVGRGRGSCCRYLQHETQPVR
jgi:hypothetical protein